MADSEKIKVARYRKSPYYVSHPVDKSISYVWMGSKGNIVDIKSLPKEVVDYLLMNTRCFDEGELKIIEDTEIAQEAVESIIEVDSYKNNSHTKDEIIDLLKGNFPKMKSELGKVTVKEEKMYVIDIAKEMNLDSSAKRAWLSEWTGVEEAVLFAKEDDEK